ncbi:PREDICTED: ashwin [Nanorana parkeri]|uniref:ashwin n=1 Tax=Nanorana parkeri TaxID=125878 RepID=UPI000855029B|nr:PREDICTED: ashwin [Nanorana parkeri]
MAQVGGRPVAMGQDCDLFLHPELLSRDFLLLSLGQKNIVVEDSVNDKEKLTEIFVQHAMPLPQRVLPKSRWGKMMEGKREVKKHTQPQQSCIAESGRKRPLIVFDGSSTNTSIKVKRKENGETAQRLHPLHTEKANNTIRTGQPTSPVSNPCSPPAKVVNSDNNGQQDSGPGSNASTGKVKTQTSPSASASAVKIKRAAPKEDSDVTSDVKPSEAKKRIMHVTWP